MNEEEQNSWSEVSRSKPVNFATAVNVGQWRDLGVPETWDFRLQNTIFLQMEKSLSSGAKWTGELRPSSVLSF